MEILNLPSNAFNLFMNILNVNNAKNVILDPYTTLVRLAILSQLPPGTKIGIYKNQIVYYQPDSMQGIYRAFRGDKRGDLHNLYLPIKKCVEWYKNEDEGEKVHIVFDFAHKGLVMLKDNYHSNNTNSDNSTYLSLGIFDGILTGRQQEIYDSITPARAELIKKEMESSPDNLIHKELKRMWTDHDKNIVYDLLTKISSEDDLQNKYRLIEVITNFLETKDDLVSQLVNKNTQSL
jgi:hypothetical protein